MAEVKQMRKDISERLDRIEETFKDIKEQIRGCESRMDEVDQRVSNIEDHGTQTDRLLAYMMQKQHLLEAHCEYIENRSRRSNKDLWRGGRGRGKYV